jgi:hypothetical protein
MKTLVSIAIVLSTLFAPVFAQPTTTESGVKVAKKKEQKPQSKPAAPAQKKAEPKKPADKK